MSGLINRTVARRYILDKIEATRPHLGITRVSADALDRLEFELRERIIRQIHSHPSVGKTYRP
tara:strand:- start:470 stop:658 length:189 start_codon:yes stop_codon:yes gene_type:complete